MLPTCYPAESQQSEDQVLLKTSTKQCKAQETSSIVPLKNIYTASKLLMLVSVMRASLSTYSVLKGEIVGTADIWHYMQNHDQTQ